MSGEHTCKALFYLGVGIAQETSFLCIREYTKTRSPLSRFLLRVTFPGGAAGYQMVSSHNLQYVRQNGMHLFPPFFFFFFFFFASIPAKIIFVLLIVGTDGSAERSASNTTKGQVQDWSNKLPKTAIKSKWRTFLYRT